MITPEQFQALLPLACQWAEEQERLILIEGAPLTSDLVNDAQAIGVAFPVRVRLRAVDTIPIPQHPMLKAVAEMTGLISPFTAGLTLQYGIFIRRDCWGERRLVVHELAHTMQYERSGSVEGFLKQYLHECLTIGYPEAPLEQEARQIERRICGSST